jgi:hypothetical protein
LTFEKQVALSCFEGLSLDGGRAHFFLKTDATFQGLNHLVGQYLFVLLFIHPPFPQSPALPGEK